MKNIFSKIILIILIIISTIGLVYSSIKIIGWNKDNKITENEIKNINDIIDVVDIHDNENVEVIEPKEVKEENKKEDPYWDYIKMNLIDVDFKELKKRNNDIVGWIKVNGTNINYPFVQSNNNEYYLTHSFDKKYTDAGWIFLDYRNSINDLDRNTVIYGHSRLNKTMFGTLRYILDSGWLNDKDNYVVKISTEYENSLWQVFSVYRIPETSDYIKTDFDNDSDFGQFINMLKNRSAFNFKTSVSKEDYILTLSTCASNNRRVVLHAKLIKRQKKN